MLKLAYVEKDITPDAPIDLCGFTLRKAGNTGTHDPLKIRWIGLRDAHGNNALLGSADLISLSRQDYRNIRDAICGSPQTERLAVGLATTHTHSGPATVRLRHCGRMDRDYVADTRNAILFSGSEAAGAEGDSVKVVWGSGFRDVAVNRRLGAKGSVDREVIVVGFMDAKTGAPLATMVNFACHPVVLGHESNGVSADYPGYLAQYMETQAGAPCLFLNGACGDINPKNDKSVSPAEAALTGEAVAKTALEALKNADAVAEDAIGWHRRQVRIPVRIPDSAADFNKRLDMLEERFGVSRDLFADRVARDCKRLAKGTYPRAVSLELALLTIGDELGILFVPGELFSSIGLRIKQLALPRKLIISGFSNGSVGYLPDRQAYDDGGYEPYFANFFYDFPEFEPSVEDVVLDGAARLLRKARNKEERDEGGTDTPVRQKAP